MTKNTFESKDGEQNVAQGDEAIGKQEKVKQKLRWLWTHPEVIWSGAGIYALSLIVAAGIALVSWHFKSKDNPSPSRTNTVSTTGGSTPATVAGRDAAVHYNTTSVCPGVYAPYAGAHVFRPKTA